MGIWAFLAAMVASSTALWIAIRVYPIQKEKDRELQLHAEKRSAYRDFFAAANRYFVKLRTTRSKASDEGFEQEFSDLIGQHRALAFYAPHDVVSKCSAFVECLTRFGYAVREQNGKKPPAKYSGIDPGSAMKDAFDTEREAMIAARSDLIMSDTETAQRAIDALRSRDLREDMK